MPCGGCILVAEDDPDIREALREHLEGLGCNVVVAVDGVDALERLAATIPPCLILADLNMPRLDGEGLAKCIRALDRLRASPIISMSANPAHGKPAEAIAHLDKPFVVGDLEASVFRLCRGGSARRAARLASSRSH